MKKITDPKRLLASSKSAAITRTRKAVAKPKSALVTRKQEDKKSSAIVKTKPSALMKREQSDVEYVNVRLLAIENLFRNDFLNVRGEAEQKRKEEEKQDFDKAEKKLETPKKKKLKFGKGGDSPSLGFFDRLKRFLFFTTLGWLLPKIIDFLPKLEGVLNIIGTVYKFAESLFGKLFDGFMTLVKFGGDLKKQTLGFIAGMKGGDYQSQFNKLEKQFDTFVNASIIAGVLAADIGLAAVDEYNKWTRAKGDVDKKKTKKGKKVTESKKEAPAKGGKAAATGAKVTQGRGGKAPSWWNRIFKGPFAKLKGPLAKFAGTAVPGFGFAVGAADAAARFKAGDKIGGTLATISAALDAATAIAALTGIGIPVASLLGTISISIDVLLLIRDILPLIGVPRKILGFSKGGRVVNKHQKGGIASRGGRQVGSPTRTAPSPKPRKPIRTKPPETKPGRDVGGEKKIKAYYSKDSGSLERPAGGWLSGLDIFSGKFEDEEKNKPFETLKKTSKILKDLPFGLGYFAGGAIDIALGQSMDVKRGLSQLSSGIAYMVDSLANQRVSKSMTSLVRDLNAFADGGVVPPTRTISSPYASVGSGDLIAKVIGPSIEQKVSEAMQSIEKDLRSIQQKKPDKAPSVAPPSAPGATMEGLAGGEYGGFTPPSGLQKKIYDYLVKEKGLSDVQALGLLANINRESSFKPGVKIIDINGKPSGGLFQWNGGRFEQMVKNVPDWQTNWRGQVDWALEEPWIQGRNGKAYMSKTFSSAQDAADWWMTEWEVVANPSRDSKKHKEYLKTVPKAPDGTARFREPQSFDMTGVSPGESRVSQDIAKFREFRTQFGGTRERNPTFGPQYYQIREKGVYGSGNYQISPLADDTNYEINVHRGAGHWENRAFDIPVPRNSKEGDAIADYWRSRGYTVIWRSSGHEDHVHVEVPKDKAQEWFRINKTASKLAIKNGKEGVIENGVWRTKPWTVEEKQRYERASKVQSSKPQKPQPPKSKTKPKPKEQQKNWWDNLNPANWGKPQAKPQAKMQQGGLIRPQKSQLPIPNSFAPYETPMASSTIAIQPIIIEKQSYTTGNKIITFPVPVSLNNSNSNVQNLSRG